MIVITPCEIANNRAPSSHGLARG